DEFQYARTVAGGATTTRKSGTTDFQIEGVALVVRGLPEDVDTAPVGGCPVSRVLGAGKDDRIGGGALRIQCRVRFYDQGGIGLREDDYTFFDTQRGAVYHRIS